MSAPQDVDEDKHPSICAILLSMLTSSCKLKGKENSSNSHGKEKYT